MLVLERPLERRYRAAATREKEVAIMSKASLLLLLVPCVLGFPEGTQAPAKKAEGPPTPPAVSYRFAPPLRLKAAGKPIDTEVGHAAPLVVDFDGDGKNDLLVGQFGDGILWFYKNVGTNAQPQYAAGVKFKAGAKEGRVPTG
jgi:hypothetical protein